ncbi:MAG: hypothetical protein R2710_05620 [Acidimicrobiales bacterium]
MAAFGGERFSPGARTRRADPKRTSGVKTTFTTVQSRDYPDGVARGPGLRRGAERRRAQLIRRSRPVDRAAVDLGGYHPFMRRRQLSRARRSPGTRSEQQRCEIRR